MTIQPVNQPATKGKQPNEDADTRCGLRRRTAVHLRLQELQLLHQSRYCLQRLLLQRPRDVREVLHGRRRLREVLP